MSDKYSHKITGDIVLDETIATVTHEKVLFDYLTMTDKEHLSVFMPRVKERVATRGPRFMSSVDKISVGEEWASFFALVPGVKSVARMELKMRVDISEDGKTLEANAQTMSLSRVVTVRNAIRSNGGVFCAEISAQFGKNIPSKVEGMIWEKILSMFIEESSEIASSCIDFYLLSK